MPNVIFRRSFINVNSLIVPDTLIDLLLDPDDSPERASSTIVYFPSNISLYSLTFL